jgi:hypothetical protein
MVHEYQIDGLPVRTGDLICTTDRGDDLLIGQFWRLIGMLIPGPVDHIAVYVGPGGRCVEAGAKGRVITFRARNNTWDAPKMLTARGGLLDELHGIAYPLATCTLSRRSELRKRESIARYCLKQARQRKPYNIDFLNSRTEKAFYCSQLAYKAYLRVGINLNTGRRAPRIPGTESIVFPQEIWSGCTHKRPKCE